MTVIAKETMLLKDTAEMQVILNKDVLEKKIQRDCYKQTDMQTENI